MWIALQLALAAPLPSRPARVPTPDVVVPEEVRPLRGRLLARHPRDLPDFASATALGGEQALIWLATHDDLLLVRKRALELLANVRTPTTQDVCLSVAASHPAATVRSAAVSCVSEDSLGLFLEDADPRVRLAAERLLAHRVVGREPQRTR